MKETCLSILKNEGYLPSIDDDGDILVKVQGLAFYVMASDTDDMYLRVLLPSFWSLDSEQEFAKAHFVANKLNKEYKVGKIFLSKDNTYASCELFINKDDVYLNKILLRLFQLLFSMRKDFADEMNGK